MWPETVAPGGVAPDGAHAPLARWGAVRPSRARERRGLLSRGRRTGFTVDGGAPAHEESANAEARATCSMTRMCPSRQTGQARKEMPVRASCRSR